MAQGKKKVSLAVELGIRTTDDLEILIARSVPVVRIFWPNDAHLFELYYDLADGESLNYTELAQLAGCSRQVVQKKIRTCVEIVEDTLNVMRAERAKPGDFLAWKPSEFFSYERAAQMHIRREVFSRLRMTLIRERWQSIAAIVDEKEEYILQVPKVGEAVLNAFKILLATERLTFSTQ